MEQQVVSRSGFTSLAEAIGAYREMFAKGKNHTARAKRNDLDHFGRFVAARAVFGLREFTPEVVTGFMEDRTRAAEAPKTVNRRLATIKHLSKFIMSRERDFIDPCFGVRSLLLPQRQPKALTLEAGELAREFIPFPLERCVFELMYRSGLRTSEVSNLCLWQVDLEHALLRSVRRKAGRIQDVSMSDSAVEAVRLYLPLRERVLFERDPGYARRSERERGAFPLIVSAHRAVPGHPLTFRMVEETLRRKVRPLVRAVGPKDFVLHHLRHSFCSHLYDVTRDLKLVAQAAGHATTQTTEIYTERRRDEVSASVRRLT